MILADHPLCEWEFGTVITEALVQLCHLDFSKVGEMGGKGGKGG
jgi:hypothetical protein